MTQAPSYPALGGLGYPSLPQGGLYLSPQQQLDALLGYQNAIGGGAFPLAAQRAAQQQVQITAKDGSLIPARSEADRPAGYAELAEYYGSAEAAAYESNIRALENGNAAQELGQYAEALQRSLAATWVPIGEWLLAMGVTEAVDPAQVPAILAEALGEHQKMYALLNDVQALAEYFTQFNDWSLQQEGKPPMSSNMEYYQGLLNQQDKEMQQVAAQQGGQITAEQRAQYDQNIQNIQNAAAQDQQQQAAQRPSFPGGAQPQQPGFPTGFSLQDLNKVPPSERWKYIDQVPANAWGNYRVTF